MLIEEDKELKLSDFIKRRAIALLVSRYAKCQDKPEHSRLRDLALEAIGNPWLEKGLWDAWVKNPDGAPDTEAREMINGWLNRRLITDFFELLSADGRADRRRLDYWLRFVPALTETPWLALGSDAMYNGSQPYKELRERAHGRVLRLDNPGSPGNNAFVMKMGNLVIVEFGLTGNACYVYPISPSPFSLGGVAISMSDLKNPLRADRLLHNDGILSWESKFDEIICPRINFRPGNERARIRRHESSQASLRAINTNQNQQVQPIPDFDETKFNEFIKKYSLYSIDKRHIGGALWVQFEHSQDSEIADGLRNMGFTYRPGRGWWRE